PRWKRWVASGDNAGGSTRTACDGASGRGGDSSGGGGVTAQVCNGCTKGVNGGAAAASRRAGCSVCRRSTAPSGKSGSVGRAWFDAIVTHGASRSAATITAYQLLSKPMGRRLVQPHT